MVCQITINRLLVDAQRSNPSCRRNLQFVAGL